NEDGTPGSTPSDARLADYARGLLVGKPCHCRRSDAPGFAKVGITLEEVKRALDDDLEGEFSYTYDGSSDWSVGRVEDPQGGPPFISVHDRNDERARKVCKLIVAALNAAKESP